LKQDEKKKDMLRTEGGGGIAPASEKNAADRNAAPSMDAKEAKEKYNAHWGTSREGRKKSWQGEEKKDPLPGGTKMPQLAGKEKRWVSGSGNARS